MNDSLKLTLPLDKIREYCATQPIMRLSVFGSALRNELTPESDIDLLVEYVPGARIGYFELAQQEIDLSELIGRNVDLRTPNELSRVFRQDIFDTARLIYEQGSRP
jgi:hypothetical protein